MEDWARYRAKDATSSAKVEKTGNRSIDELPVAAFGE
jgi:hypothetical protein